GLRRLQYQTGQYAQLLTDYKKELEKLPEAAQAEVLLLAANSERQLGHSKEAEALYRDIIAKYPDREEAKDAAYQRLINVYNTDPSGLNAAVDEFLATNPTGERADQAKLLKAEALYKQQNYTEAASIYGELRGSQLSPKLRAEAAYKLGLCHVQTKNLEGVIEAFTYYIQTFPDSPEIPAAMGQRALAYEQGKNYTGALNELNIILAKYPKAREREATLQLKALIVGQQENSKGMVDTFRQLLKEFPRSSVAAQAQYYIGKAAFEAKDYKTALAGLNTARQLNKEQYYNLASLRIILCQFYLKNQAALTKEVNDVMASSATANVPPEVLEWLGIQYYIEKNFDDAGKAFKGVALLYDDPAIPPRALNKAALAYRQAGNTDEADRLSRELRERYPNYAGG